MQLVFRPLPAGGPPPAPGEVHIRPQQSEHQQRRDLACLVLEHGLEALPRGPAPATHIVVSDDPTFDDLLAATFVQRLLSGPSLPDGCKAFARYAAVVRQGLRPGAIPLHASLEGIFLALRNAVGRPQESLTEPGAAARFAEEWSRMAACILAAAAEGRDPFTTPIFETGPEFALERAFLADDRKAYEQDVRRGERWLVRIPRETLPTAGLLLRRPTSLLFKHWAREDREAPGGKGYLFLAVDWGEGQWVFSTDPVQRLSLLPLAEEFQKSETARDAGRAAADPWFDGKPFNYTLVAAPRQGTLLSQTQVLRVVRKWTAAISVDQRRRWKLPAAAALIAGLLALGAVFRWWPTTPPPPEPPPPPFAMSAWVNGKLMGEEEVFRSERDRTSSVELEVALGKDDTEVTFSLPRRVCQPAKLRVRLQSETGLSAKSTVSVKNGNSKEEPPRPLVPPDGTATILPNVFESGDLPAFFDAGDNTIRLHLSNPGGDAQMVSLRLSWHTDLEFQRHLYLVALGVSEYEDTTLTALSSAGKDAKDLVTAFKDQNENKFFEDVHVYSDEALTGAKAEKRNLFEGLKFLEKADSRSLVIVTLSGHGTLSGNGRFLFLNRDFLNGTDAAVRGSTSWRDFEEFFEKMPCPVLVVMDACHSGASKLRGVRVAGTAEMKDGVADALQASNKGIVILAACGGDETAQVAENGRNGVLTLAVLEAITAERRAAKVNALLPWEKGHAVVTLKDLKEYVVERVPELIGVKQTVVMQATPGLELQDIAIAKPK